MEFIEFETAASITRNFQPLVVPGLLQTEDYARVMLGELSADPPDRINSRVELRMKRQELLDRDNAPELFFILDEAVIRRLVGDRSIMRGQLRRLLDVAAKPRVTIEVVPFSAGAHPGLNGSFVIQEFPTTGNDDVLYLEGPQGEEIRREDPALITSYREIFERLRRLSLGRKDSVALLSDLADGLA